MVLRGSVSGGAANGGGRESGSLPYATARRSAIITLNVPETVWLLTRCGFKGRTRDS